jgi:hypothetical protein
MANGVEVSFIDPGGATHRLPLSEAAGLPFDQYRPIRASTSYRGQDHWPGLYWCATTRTFIPYESRLEQSRLLLCDFDAKVSGIAPQPFRLHFSHGATQRTHVPDYFLRLSDGRERVIDVTPSRKLGDPAIQARANATREACVLVGWDYHVLSESDPTLLANVRWLAGFRRPVHDAADIISMILEACHVPTPIGAVGDRTAHQAIVRSVLFHLMWARRLIADLSRPLTNSTLVSQPQEDQE